MSVKFEDIVESLETDEELANRVKEKFGLKNQDEIDVEIAGLKKKNADLLGKIAKHKESEKTVAADIEELKTLKSGLKELNIEGLFDDNDVVDTVTFADSISEINKKLHSDVTQGVDVPKELSDARKELEEVKSQSTEFRKNLVKRDKEFEQLNTNYEALMQEKALCDQALNNIMVNQEFKTLLVGRGLKPEMAEALAPFLIAKSGAKVYKDDDGHFKAGCEENTTTIQGWLDAFQLSAEGKAIIPEIEVQGSGSTNANGRAKKKFDDYSMTELAELYRQDKKEYDRVMKTRGIK